MNEPNYKNKKKNEEIALRMIQPPVFDKPCKFGVNTTTNGTTWEKEEAGWKCSDVFITSSQVTNYYCFGVDYKCHTTIKETEVTKKKAASKTEEKIA